MTKDQAGDIRNLAERMVETALELDRATRAHHQAKSNFESNLRMQQQEKENK